MVKSPWSENEYNDGENHTRGVFLRLIPFVVQNFLKLADVNWVRLSDNIMAGDPKRVKYSWRLALWLKMWLNGVE